MADGNSPEDTPRGRIVRSVSFVSKVGYDRAVARAEAAERKLAVLEGALTWGTSCLSCARILDGAYEETVRREKAEAKLAEIAAYCRVRLQRPGPFGMSPTVAELILGMAEGGGEEASDGR